MKIKVKKLSQDAVIPKYQTEDSAGFDFHAIEDMEIFPLTTVVIKTGLSFEIPKGYELQVRPRSGMSLKTKIRIGNSPGTIDSDYRGEVCIIVDNIDCNTDKRIPFKINKGDRIAQGVICTLPKIEIEESLELSQTERGSNGFGSTGI